MTKIRRERTMVFTILVLIRNGRDSDSMLGDPVYWRLLTRYNELRHAEAEAAK